MFRMILTGFWAFLFFTSCNQAQKPISESPNPTPKSYPTSDMEADFFLNGAGDTIYLVKQSAEEWKAQLTDMEYRVLRQAGTERAFTSDLLHNKKSGVYTCGACGFPLFASDTKFKSGTGWPSFYEPIDPAHVGEIEDLSYGMRRVEVVCNRCEGHLGHVFPDGPRPTGLRYCINGVSLDFVETSEAEAMETKQ